MKHVFNADAVTFETNGVRADLFKIIFKRECKIGGVNGRSHTPT